MRTEKKAHAKIGHAKAMMYRTNVFSPASDLEAMVDAYGAAAVIKAAHVIEKLIREHGDSIHNGLINSQLNSLPLPELRKQNKPENKGRKSA